MLFTKVRRSIQAQLIVIIAGASITAATTSTLGHYFFTEKLIENSIEQQMQSALQLTADYLEENYSEEIRYDLNLLNSSAEINNLLGSSSNEYFIHQQNVEKLFLSFSVNRSNLYHALRLIDVSGNELAIIENKRRVRKLETVITSKPTPTNLRIGELFLQLKKSEAGTIIFSRPATENNTIYFFAGIAKNDPDIGGFGGAIIITFTLDQFTAYLNNFKVFGYSVVWLFTHSGETIYAINEENAANPFPYLYNSKEKPNNLSIYTSKKMAENSIQHIIQTAIVLPPEAKRALLKNLIAITLIILSSITLTGIIIAFATAKRIVSPIKNLTRLSQKVAAGNFNVHIPIHGKDELAKLSQAFNIMIDELKEQRHELQLLANNDALTQLPNRRKFEETLTKTLKHSERTNNSIAILYIDLDQFKYTNDTFGHPAGDKLIQDVANRLKLTVRETDTVARLGGDEFAIILNPHQTILDTEKVARKILDELSKPFNIEKHKVFSGGSIGISIYPTNGKNSTELVKNADTAMYFAKQSGRNNYQLYSADLSTESNEKIILGSLIRRAIEKNNLAMHYQPKICLKTGGIIGSEALIRWQNEGGKNITPSKIIHIAEASGFADKIDQWVINTVFKQIQEWSKLNIPMLPVSINVSSKLLNQKKIIGILNHALSSHKINPSLIEIEITENHLIGNYQQAQETLHILRKMGIKLAIDDFGTGYSSLSYLKNIEADILKIDRKFVTNTMQNSADQSIATAIVQLALSLKMHVIVEGIETEEQKNFFKLLGAHSAQGFYYSKALPADEFIEYATKLCLIKN